MKVLIVDDEPLEVLNIESIFREISPHIKTYTAANGPEAMTIIEKELVDIVCLDIQMPGWDGLETLRRIKESLPHIKVMLISAHGEFEYAQQAISAGASGYMLKPVIPQDLENTYTKLEKEIKIAQSDNALLLQAAAEEWANGQRAKQFPFGPGMPIHPNIVTILHFEGNQPHVKQEWDSMICHLIENTIPVPNPVNGRWVYLTVYQGTVEEVKERLAVFKVKTGGNWRFGVGQIVQDPAELHQSYAHAVKALLSKDEAVIQQCLRFLSDKYDEQISLNQLAAEVHLSASHLSRLFKSQLGITFVDVLTKIRIDRAKEMLRNKELPIQFISDRTGFSSPDYFSSTFRRLEGISPSQYRQKEDIRCL